MVELSVSEDVLQTLLEDYIVCSLRAERLIFEDVYRLFVKPADVKSSSELRQIEFFPRSTRELLEALQLFAFTTNTSSQRGTADMILKSPFSFSSETSCDASFIKASHEHRERDARSSLQSAKANVMLEA